MGSSTPAHSASSTGPELPTQLCFSGDPAQPEASSPYVVLCFGSESLTLAPWCSDVTMSRHAVRGEFACWVVVSVPSEVLQPLLHPGVKKRSVRFQETRCQSGDGLF